MRVTALLFAKPGRGEFIRQHIDMDDSAMPTTLGEFEARSFNAVRHFWPQAAVDKAEYVEKCAGGKRYVVEGRNGGWSVEWATDAQMQETKRHIEEYMSGNMDSEKFIAYMTTVQPTERRTL